MATTSKVTLGDRLRALEAGIKANFTVPELTAKIDSFLAAQTTAVMATNAYHAAIGAEKASNALAVVFRGQVEGFAVARYGKTNPILSQLGLTPAKSKKPSAAVKAVAVLKVKATRKARNTMGKRQKEKVVGAVDPAIAAALAAGTVVGTAAPATQPAAGTPATAAVAPATTGTAMVLGTPPAPTTGHTG